MSENHKELEGRYPTASNGVVAWDLNAQLILSATAINELLPSKYKDLLQELRAG